MSERTEKRELSEQDMASVMKAFQEVVAEKAADRPAYVAAFFEVWEVALRNVRDAREAVDAHPSVEVTLEAWKELLQPYAFFTQLTYARLMGHLELPEDERLRALAGQLDEAWAAFFASVLKRHPKAADLVARLSAARQTVHNEVVPLYTGEAATELTPTWAKATTALEKDHPEFAEVLAND